MTLLLEAAKMKIARIFPDDDEKFARFCVVGALILAFCVNLPFLVSNTVFGSDDWAWIWVYRSQGAAAIFHYMWDAAHPGYAPFLNALLFLGGEHAGQVAHICAIAFHLGCGWLLWRIFREAKVTAAVSASLSILYLAAPFLADLHASLAHALYDPVIFFYLLSIYLCMRRGALALISAVGTMIIGLTIETLVALEPLRWWLLYRRHGNVRATIRAAIPFAALALTIAIVRIFWLKPKGIYQGYNAFLHPSLGNYLRLAKHSLIFFLDIKQPVVFAGSLMTHDNPFFAWFVFIGACVVTLNLWRAREAETKELLGLLIVGAITTVLGMIPYIAINDVPSRVDVSSRYAVASQFGALMLAVVGIQLLRFAPLRAIALTGLVFIFMANQLQLGKWLLFEGQVVADFRSQVGAYLAHSSPQVLVVDFSPPSHDFLYINRACLSSYDTNVSLEIAGWRNHSFVFDRACGAQIYHNPAGCFITGYGRPRPCPLERRTAEFRLKSDLGPFTHFHLAGLIADNLNNTLLAAGKLTIANNQAQRLTLPRNH